MTTGRIAGNFNLGKFSVTFDGFCGQPVATPVDNMRIHYDVRVTGKGARRRVGKSLLYSPSKLLIHMGIWTQCNTWFLG